MLRTISHAAALFGSFSPKLTVILYSCCLLSGCLLISEPPRTHALNAETLKLEGQWLAAIKEYELHVKARIESAHRPASENPYFYYLLIGDLYLENGDFAQAKTSYELALSEQVSSDLVHDRLRDLGKWLAKEKHYEQAIDVLLSYRHLDPALFDIEIDRIHKEMVRAEQEESENN
jgi:tetratricopeptide (TPR) repeat protein